MGGDIEFRGVQGRTLDDQTRAMAAGYRSVAEMAIDELAEIVMRLQARVETLEALTGTTTVDTSQGTCTWGG